MFQGYGVRYVMYSIRLLENWSIVEFSEMIQYFFSIFNIRKSSKSSRRGSMLERLKYCHKLIRLMSYSKNRRRAWIVLDVFKSSDTFAFWSFCRSSNKWIVMSESKLFCSVSYYFYKQEIVSIYQIKQNRKLYEVWSVSQKI